MSSSRAGGTSPESLAAPMRAMTSLQCRTAGRSVVYRVPGGLPKHARMTRSSVACAARREGRDSDGEAKGRSWKEIGKEAAGLAREVARKATDSVRGLVARRADGPAPSGRRVDRVEAQWERPSSPDAKSLAPLFGGGLLGRAIGGLVGTAIQVRHPSAGANFTRFAYRCRSEPRCFTGCRGGAARGPG